MNAVYTDDPSKCMAAPTAWSSSPGTWRTTMITWSLPALPPGDHRPRRSGVAPNSPTALPALRAGRVVINRVIHNPHLNNPEGRHDRPRCRNRS